MAKNVVLLRVGVDAWCGGIQGPLFEDGTFEFICIPERKRVSVHTYGNMVGRNSEPVVRYFPEARRKLMTAQTVHVDPEWETFTYGDPTPPKRSLRRLQPGDFLVFYCGCRSGAGRVAGRTTVAQPSTFDKGVLKSEFRENYHVRYPTVFKQQKEDLVLVKGGPCSRLFRKGHQISAEGQDRNGTPLKVLSPAMQKVFGSFGGRISIQRSPPRWVEPGFVDGRWLFEGPGVGGRFRHRHCSGMQCQIGPCGKPVPCESLRRLHRADLRRLDSPVHLFPQSSVETTMIYTHVLNKGGQGARSPLDRR
jgi:hypothetical protein